MAKHAHDERTALVDPVSGTHLRPLRVAPGRVLLVETQQERVSQWRRALAPGRVIQAETLAEAEALLEGETPDLFLVGCPVRGPGLDTEALVAFLRSHEGLADPATTYVEARRCTLSEVAGLRALGVTVRPGNRWQPVAGDWVRLAYATGIGSTNDDDTYELAKNIAATEVAARHELTAAHLELLRALLEEDQRRAVAELVGRSHGTVRVQLGQMRDRSQLTTAELVRETFGVAAKAMPTLAELLR